MEESMDILLVGTYTQHDAPAVLEKQELGKGIYLILYNEILGDVAGTPLIIQMQNPSWVCLMKNRLFAVSESGSRKQAICSGKRTANRFSAKDTSERIKKPLTGSLAPFK